MVGYLLFNVISALYLVAGVLQRNLHLIKIPLRVTSFTFLLMLAAELYFKPIEKSYRHL